MAHAAVNARPAAGKHSIDQGAKAAQVVGAGLVGLAHHIHGNAAQLAQGGIDIEVVKHPAHLLAKHGFEVFHLHAAQGDGANFGQVNLAVAV